VQWQDHPNAVKLPTVYTTLISSAAATKQLTDTSWVFVDCRYDLHDTAWGRQQYLAAHIPGAVYASLSHDLAAPTTGSNGRHPMPDINHIAATFGRFGIGAATQVVVYDQDAGMYASRMWWMLRYLGHDAAAVLDGGFAKWTAERRPTRTGEESRPPATFTPQVRPAMRRDLADVQSIVRDRSAQLVDARAPERFEGRSETIDKRAGHIAGAVNHFYKLNLAEDGTMLPPETLRDNFAKLLAGKAPDQMVMYCGSGVTACHNLLAMEHAGLKGTPLYPGSWSEWSSDPDRPSEQGPAK
jgi:thiosulfate/3-mercaptopyruvate sulfurtransferase